MNRKTLFTIAAAIIFFSLSMQGASAQTTDAGEARRFEVGGHFTTLKDQENESAEYGFGGRIGYNVHRNVTLEAEVNFLPELDDFSGGDKVQGLFGAKVGKRFERVGLFAKVRPGFFHQREAQIRLRQDAGCIAVFPLPPGCLETSGRTRLSVDVGGVFEVYPTSRTIIRFDAGDTIVRVRDRNDHVIQGSVSVGFRF